MKTVFDRYHKKYDLWYERNNFAYLSELEVIKKVLPERGKGLEIGVGTGRFAASLGIETGVDPSKKMIGIARKRGVDARLGYGEKLPFANNTFHYVAIIITICFVNDPCKVLREARRALKKNGKIIIGLVDKESFLGQFYQRKKSVFYKQANFLSIKKISGLLKEAGFSKLSYYQTVFDLPSKIESIETPQKGFGKGGFVVILGRKQ